MSDATPTEKIAVLSARLRARRALQDAPHRRARACCSFCWREGHRAPTCRFRYLSIWTDGVDLFIASSAEEARTIALDPLPEDMRDAIPIDIWERVNEEPLVLLVDSNEERWTQRAWIVANGPGLLATEGGHVAIGRRAPR